MTQIRPATLDDLRAIDTLRKADGDALGFIPKARYEAIVTGAIVAGRDRARYERLWVAEDEGEITGFLYGAHHRAGSKVEQVCVRRDARRFERASALVRVLEDEAGNRGAPLLKCRVAADLEAVLFWRASGYEPIATVRATFLGHRKSYSNRPLTHFEKPLAQIPLLGAA